MTGIEVAVAAAVASTVLSSVGAVQQGNAQKKAANYQAAQREQQAGQDRATSQRQAIGQRKQANLVASRTRANAAASGGGAFDPNVVDILGDIEGQGEYNALSALFNGEERARGMEMQASAARYQGRQAQTAGYTKAASTLLDGASQAAMMKYSPSGGAFSGGTSQDAIGTNNEDWLYR